MARITGVDIPDKKRLEVGLTAIYGIGRPRALQILKAVGLGPDARAKDLSEGDLKKIRDFIDSNYVVEGELKSEVSASIKRLIEIKCYRGMRHVKGLPVRGQRSKTNARTRKGKVKKQVANKKIAKK